MSVLEGASHPEGASSPIYELEGASKPEGEVPFGCYVPTLIFRPTLSFSEVREGEVPFGSSFESYWVFANSSLAHPLLLKASATSTSDIAVVQVAPCGAVKFDSAYPPLRYFVGLQWE